MLNRLTFGCVKLLNNGMLKIDKGDCFLTFKIFDILNLNTFSALPRELIIV